ncbi:hypothetical protein [Streptomyces sp. CAU 1734]|uniref:hypothetical protein n=1 Tax=Streptomyces sp. CAU 1734 TaxID=3140360 RepID=UPI00326120EE
MSNETTAGRSAPALPQTSADAATAESREVLAARVRVGAAARGLDAPSVGRRVERCENELKFTRSGGPAGEALVAGVELELAEWRRIAALLAGVSGTYRPAGDPVVAAAETALAAREEAARAAKQAAEEDRKARRHWALRRAHALLDLAQADRLDASVPVTADDPGAWPMLTGHNPMAVARIDGWMARALAGRSGALSDPAVRTAALAALPERVTSHAALLEALTTPHPGTCVSADELEFLGELARAAPEATVRLARWLAAPR